jgi:hypothetical protein
MWDACGLDYDESEEPDVRSVKSKMSDSLLG